MIATFRPQPRHATLSVTGSSGYEIFISFFYTIKFPKNVYNFFGNYRWHGSYSPIAFRIKMFINSIK